MTLSLASIAPAAAIASPPPSTLNHLVLASKPHSGDNPPDFTTWSFAMWGQLDYFTPWGTFDFAFDGHGLAPSTEYVLLYYPDPWPGNGLICLMSGASDASGNIELHKQPGDNIGALPIATDYNADPVKTTYPGVTGAKIWLVLTADVECGTDVPHMTAWHPTQYLFELWLIQYSLPVAGPPQTCITRNFWNLITHAPDSVIVCWVA